MDTYEKLGKLISEKIDSSENETATEQIEQKENQPKTFGDMNTASFLFNEYKNQKKDSNVGEVVRDYTEDAPVKIITDATANFENLDLRGHNV